MNQTMLFPHEAIPVPDDVDRCDVLVISGIRDLASGHIPTFERQILAAIEKLDPRIVRLGGALGVDTQALIALHGSDACSSMLEVWLPATFQDAPALSRARLVLADEIIELGRDPSNPWSYLARNLAMLTGVIRPDDLRRSRPYANGLLAFTDGQRMGGTNHAIANALLADLPTWIEIVERKMP